MHDSHLRLIADRRRSVSPGGFLGGVVARHDSPHEFVKEGNGERGVTVTRAPDHAFRDQLS
jgi:hypothetical protein